ncbi:5'-3' exonuclease PLD3 isoform X2 [Acanthochromis polyacanthus]|uniref:5'-3' exonuclease PLD3 isoform X2 n=1 Tax=Acanthochromis polyacanthus TaxID=80966 RepID=UPI000B9070AB|nr:5'-3' exonuclease PLD3 isoform X2 [Acanthochromis polyacanthus]
MDTDESDSESVHSQEVMETLESPTAEQEEEAADEAHLTELKYCSVVLDRLQAGDKSGGKELEEKEDMSRKGEKRVSRIPTFHKRPFSTEVSGPKKDPPVHVASEKPGGVVEASKSKPTEVRETALPLPSVRVPKIGLEAPPVLSSAEQAASTAPSSIPTAPKSWSLSESVPYPLITASLRPALRAQQDSEQEEREILRTEADTLPVEPVSLLPNEGSLSQRPREDTTEKFDVEGEGKITLSAPEKPTEKTAEVCEVDAIMDEEPPWETEPMTAAALKDSGSSSDAESVDKDLAGEEPDSHDSGDLKELQEPLIIQSEVPSLAEKRADTDESSSRASGKPAKATSSKSTRRSECSNFALFCLLPTTLLLLGGFGQHVWHYGLPMSVAQLMAQLELHWLEGFGLIPEPCSTDCRVHLVESIPAGLYESSPLSGWNIANSWLHLLNEANSSVHIAAFYFTLRDSDLQLDESSDSEGRKVFKKLKELESKGINLQIAVNAPQTSMQDTAELAATGAEVREVDLKAVTGGIIHTKLWVVDQKHFYLGSANMDWRSLSEVKEVGLLVQNCSCLAQDALRIFGIYWSVGGLINGTLPPYWPARLTALSSAENPLHLKFNGVPAQVYLSSAPPQISARGRSDDLSTILSVINDAQKFIYISVMDYLPLSQFAEPVRFWPAIDSSLRAAACTRGVEVKLMVSCWKHSPAAMFTFLQSLLVLSRPPLKCSIEVKIFTVPSTAEQMKIPFARVNHAKYMVTDRVVYIGTSNWSENYFTHTAGVGLVVNQTDSVVEKGQQTLQSQAEDLFLRDWGSSYSSWLSVDDVDVCPLSPH